VQRSTRPRQGPNCNNGGSGIKHKSLTNHQRLVTKKEQGSSSSVVYQKNRKNKGGGEGGGKDPLMKTESHKKREKIRGCRM